MTKLTKELVEASLIPELTNQGWQQLIEATKNIQITPDTISVAYNDLSKLRLIYEYLDGRLDEENKEDKERIKARNEGYGKIMKQIYEILMSAEPQFIEGNKQILAKEKVVKLEIKKQNDIRSRHVEFVNDMTKFITAASDTKELARIQSLIGTEKSRTPFYGDYHPIIKDVCDSLLKLIDDRKRMIKDNAKLEKEYKKWFDTGDIVMATQIKEQIELNQLVIAENAQQIAQDAYKQVSAVAILDNELVSAAISPRLHRWSWKISDIELLYKKMPELVEKVPNTKAVNAFMKQKIEEKELNADQDNNFNGLVLYWKSFFVSVNK